MDRQDISSGGPWEDVVGYSRAVRAGDHVFVAGTTAAQSDGAIFGGNDAYLQARRCFEIIERALAEAGATLADVVRTRMFVTDISRWEEFGRAHGEFFRAVKPAATMVEVSRLLTPEMLIEVEVDAVVGAGERPDGTGD
jgi:enamine deaminase RidA (YjgF/YER057c/UK114 family)